MANLERLRDRLPLLVFVLLVIVALMLLGFACACLTGDPMVALERALAFAPALPESVHAWAVVFATLAGSLLVVRASRAADRASPALLQRFRL